MKTPTQSIRGLAPFIAVSLLSCPWSATSRAAAPLPTPASTTQIIESNFPYEIPVRMWVSTEGFRRGDEITIVTVRGDRPRIEPDGTYLVQGSFVLSSAPAATLALSLTAPRPGGYGPWTDLQRTNIQEGSGTFTLVATMRTPGQFHVSFYFPERSETPGRTQSFAHGGIYFDNR